MHPSEEVARRIVEALIASGVHHVVYCPGSRSAPLAYALEGACARGQVSAHVRLDERSAAFLALGLSMGARVCVRGEQGEGSGSREEANGRYAMRTPRGDEPVAIVTTSGTAVAELHAAVAEASHADIPLVVISADRPHEMRGVGASQTTDQVKIFGSHPRTFEEIPADTEPGQQLSVRVARAVATACGLPTGRPGPVHLNVAFRDPLVPTSWEPLSQGTVSSEPQVLSESQIPRVYVSRPMPLEWDSVVRAGLRTLVLAADGAGDEAGLWADSAGVPLLAEPTVRSVSSAAWLPHQQALLGDEEIAGSIEQVVLVGRPTLSRPVGALLARVPRLIVVDPHSTWTDVAGQASCVVPDLSPASPGWARTHRDLLDSRAPSWQENLRAASAQAESTCLRLLENTGDSPNAASVVRALWEQTSTLVVGASNSIRVLDLVASGPGPCAVFSNRGLAGIDGTIATAVGIAQRSISRVEEADCAAGVRDDGRSQTVTAVMGDLTFLHDAGALAVTRGEVSPHLRVVVLDDAGGAIFASLEHSRAPEAVYERWFGVAQETDIPVLARAYGARVQTITSCTELRASLMREADGIEVLYVPLSRDPGLLEVLKSL